MYSENKRESWRRNNSNEVDNIDNNATCITDITYNDNDHKLYWHNTIYDECLSV